MYHLVSVNNKGMAPHLTKNDYEVFSIQRTGWDWWWYAVEWEWIGWECLKCDEDEGTGCEDGASDTDW